MYKYTPHFQKKDITQKGSERSPISSWVWSLGAWWGGGGSGKHQVWDCEMPQGQSAGHWEAIGRDEPESDRAVMGMGTAVITSWDLDS